MSPTLIAVLVLMSLAYTPRPQTGLTQPAPAWQFPAELVTTPLPLKPDEIAWLKRDGAESAERRRFEWLGVNGSLMLITSRTWRAQHRPERCFEVWGLSLDDSRALLVAPDLTLRFVSLSDHHGGSAISAAYWFQSAERTTDDYGARIWADLAPTRQTWVLVTVLFDRAHDPASPDTHSLYLTLRDVVARNLKGDTP